MSRPHNDAQIETWFLTGEVYPPLPNTVDDFMIDAGKIMDRNSVDQILGPVIFRTSDSKLWRAEIVCDLFEIDEKELTDTLENYGR